MIKIIQPVKFVSLQGGVMSQQLPDGCTILYNESEVSERIEPIGKQLAEEFIDNNPVVLVTLKGGFVFAAHLIQHMDIELETAFVQPSSYKGGDRSSGKVDILMDIHDDLANRHVIIIEDVIDSGTTTTKLLELVQAKDPASITMVTMIDKPHTHPPMQIDYCCFVYEGDDFLIGWGLDFDQTYRNLPYIVAMPRPTT